MKNEFAVYIGRFQPFHLGHVHVINEALQDSQNLVIFIGSANESRTVKNPFTYEERASVIKDWIKENNLVERVSILPVMDEPTDEGWIEYLINSIRIFTNNSNSTVIVGHDKDASSWYLKAFPHYGVQFVSNFEGINATDIREGYFKNEPVSHFNGKLPEAMKLFLSRFRLYDTHAYREVCDLANPLVKVETPKDYPRIDHTADCIVLGTYEDYDTPYILLIKRKNDPGKGEWALPGGFVEVGETIMESAYRELEEETGISRESLAKDVPEGLTFDYPDRDPRGRIITTAYVLECDGYIDYLSYEAKDDAEEVQWFPLSSSVLGALPLFLDHQYIIEKCLENENICTIA